MIVVCVLLVAAAAACLYGSLLSTLRANADRLVPYWRNPDRLPARSLVLRLLGVVFLVVGVTLATSVVGYWSAMIPLVLLAPGALMVVRHNGRLHARG